MRCTYTYIYGSSQPYVYTPCIRTYIYGSGLIYVYTHHKPLICAYIYGSGQPYVYTPCIRTYIYGSGQTYVYMHHKPLIRAYACCWPSLRIHVSTYICMLLVNPTCVPLACKWWCGERRLSLSVTKVVYFRGHAIFDSQVVYFLFEKVMQYLIRSSINVDGFWSGVFKHAANMCPFLAPTCLQGHM